WLALDAPDRVAGLVLASTPTRGRALHTGGWRRAVDFARCMVRPARAAEACLAVRVLSERFVATHPAAIADIRARASMRPASHRGLLTLLAAAATHDVDGHLDAIRADVLVIAGADDVLLPVAEQQRLAGRLGRSCFVVIPDAGHDVSAEVPDAVAALVAAHALPA
ncbi:MAG: alpha/beta hydrolase, partial [Candidatus Binatia bacterium]